MKKFIFIWLVTVLPIFAVLPSGYIEPYFSKTKGKYYQGGVDNTIINDIATASRSITMAMHYLTNKNITKALIKAHESGLKVTVIINDTKINSKRYRQLKCAGILLRNYDSTQASARSRILVIDDRVVWIGSANYTVYAFYRNHNNFLRINSESVAQYYKKRLSATDKSLIKSTTPYVSDDKKVEIYLSQENNVTQRIVSLIDSSRKSINILAFRLHSKSIVASLIRAKKRGIRVSAVFDAAQVKRHTTSQFYTLKREKMAARLDRNRFRLTSQLLVIDDEIVATGSCNFTDQSGGEKGENTVVVSDRFIAKRFLKHFEEIYRK